MAYSTFMLLCALLYVIDFFAGGTAALSWLPRVTTILLVILGLYAIVAIFGLTLWYFLTPRETIDVLANRIKANALLVYPQYSRIEILTQRKPNSRPEYATNPSLDSWEGCIVGYDKNNRHHAIAHVSRRDFSGLREIIKQLDRDLAEKVRVKGPEYQLHAYGL